MVKQYLDVCEWRILLGFTYDANGFPVPASPTTLRTVKCRYENFKSGNRKEWTGVDGKTILQQGTIYIKKGDLCPDKFQKVKITRGPETIFEGNILNVYKGQLNTTIAV